MTSQHFKDAALTIANALGDAGITYDVYMLLNLTDNLISIGANFTEPAETEPDYTTHEGRVMAALGSYEVIRYMQEGRRINAIKELRNIVSCGLKEAKDAVEDHRVNIHYVSQY